MRAPVEWQEPPWEAPFDEKALLRAIPAEATMTGMFLDAVANLARSRGQSAPTARDRYTPFKPYPLREHCALLVEVGRLVYPRSPVRLALRRIGHGTPQALVASTVGKVVFGSVEGPLEVLRAMARSYMVHMQPGSIEVEHAGPRAAVVHLSEIHNFLDSHHIGVFEGALRYAGVDAAVKIRSFSRTSADLLCTWT